MLIQFPGIFLESESCLTGVDKMNVCTSFLTGISWGDSGKEKIRAEEREDEVGCGCRRSCAALGSVLGCCGWRSLCFCPRDPSDSRLLLAGC